MYDVDMRPNILQEPPPRRGYLPPLCRLQEIARGRLPTLSSPPFRDLLVYRYPDGAGIVVLMRSGTMELESMDLDSFRGSMGGMLGMMPHGDARKVFDRFTQRQNGRFIM